MFNNVFQYSFLFYFHFHTEHCMHDEGLLLVYVCVYIGICVCIYMDLFLRDKKVLQVIWILHGAELFLHL